MTDKTFAPDMDRDKGGFIHFPRDVEYRREHFIKEAMDHPAKANLFLTEELIKFVSEPGDMIMDITSGTGSILLGCLMGRRVVAIELSEQYAGWIEQSAKKMGLISPSQYMIFQGDCRDFLPLSNMTAIVFSPPYAGAFNAGGGILAREEKLMKSVEDYRADPRNLGNLNDFLYNQAMEQIYKKCFDSLKPGGTLSLIIKDRIKGQQRVELGLNHIKAMNKIGFEMFEWHRWAPPGHMFTAMKKSKGEKVITDEHIIIMRRPGGPE